MSLHQFFSILRARLGVAGLIMLVTIALAVGWVKLRPTHYTARAPILVDVRTDPVGSTPLQGMVSPGYMSTQIDIVKSDRVAERVVKMLPADQQPMAAAARIRRQGAYCAGARLRAAGRAGRQARA